MYMHMYLAPSLVFVCQSVSDIYENKCYDRTMGSESYDRPTDRPTDLTTNGPTDRSTDGHKGS